MALIQVYGPNPDLWPLSKFDALKCFRYTFCEWLLTGIACTDKALPISVHFGSFKLAVYIKQMFFPFLEHCFII